MLTTDCRVIVHGIGGANSDAKGRERTQQSWWCLRSKEEMCVTKKQNLGAFHGEWCVRNETEWVGEGERGEGSEGDVMEG